MNADLEAVKRAARGHWRELLAEHGIPHEHLDGRNHPCPKCGGVDRFRLIDPDRGACFCNQCFREKNGDGIAALRWLRDWDFKETLQWLSGHLGLNGPAKAAAVKPKRDSRAWPIVDTYDYTDETGKLIHQVLRKEDPAWDGTGKKHKDFPQRRPDPEKPGEWIWSTKGCLAIPYQLPELLENPDLRIYVVEGEKDVETLSKLGLLGTCNPGGAGKWHLLEPETVKRVFTGRDVVILADADPAGQDHAKEVQESLKALAKTLRVIEVFPGSGPGQDVTDWVERGGTAAALKELVGAQRDVATGPEKPRFEIFYIGDPEREPTITLEEPLIEGLLLPGYTVAFGKWKRAKKTTFFLGMAFALQAGIPFLGRKTRKTRCLWIQRDMPISLFVKYGRKIRGGLGLGPTPIPFVGDPVNFAKPEDQVAFLAFLDALPDDKKPEIIFIDSSRAVTRTKENDSDEVSAFTRGFLCDELRDRRKLSVVLVGHPGKHQDSMRGAGEWEAGADTVFAMTPYPADRSKKWQYTQILGEGRHEPIELTFTIEDFSNSGGVCRIIEIDQETKARLSGKDPADSIKNRILKYLAEHPGPQLHTEIIAKVEGRNDDIRNELINLKAMGWIVLTWIFAGGKLARGFS